MARGTLMMITSDFNVGKHLPRDSSIPAAFAAVCKMLRIENQCTPAYATSEE